jgi:hypothetical protein
MRANLRYGSAMLWMLLLSEITIAQVKNRSQVFQVNGRSGEATVIEVNGHEYVDLQALVRVANGSLGFEGNRLVVTLPSPVSAPADTPASNKPSDSVFSRDFMKAGIEEIALMREWVSPLASAIHNGYPITEEWVAQYREQAANGLRLASAAASTDDDRKGLELLRNEFEAVREWSARLVNARKSMDTAKYAMSEDALRNDPLSQKIIACAHFFAPMLGSGSFQDDPACH